MTPEELQFAESVKYTARPIILIPVDGGFVIMEAYGTHRKPICTIPSAELARWATNDFAHQRSRRAEAVKSRLVEINLDHFDFNL